MADKRRPQRRSMRLLEADKADTIIEVSQKVKPVEGTNSKSRTSTKQPNDYETSRKVRMAENEKKLNDLRLPRLARSLSMAANDKTKKRKQKSFESADTDKEYVPDSESDNVFEGDDDLRNEEDATIAEVPKKKMGRRNKRTSKVSKMPAYIKPAAKLDDLISKNKIIGPRTLHWPTLKKLNVESQFDEWLTPAWKKLFSITLPVYKELVYDFFSTYRYNKHVDSVTSRSAMQFTLCGKDFDLSFSEFALAMNLYTTDEINSEDFKNGIDGWPSGVEPPSFWPTVGAGDYQVCQSNTSITQPCLKILHRSIAETINQRATCTHHVTRSDMLYMFCIVQNAPCNLAKCLARFLYKSSGKKHNAAVCGGAYITQLALGLGVITERDLVNMTEVATTTYFDEPHLVKLGIVENDLPLRFVENKNYSGVDASATKEKNCTVNTEAVQDPRLSVLENDLTWTNKALHFLLKRIGHPIAPPHNAAGNTPRPSGNAAGPSSVRAPGPSAAGQSANKYNKKTAARLPLLNDETSGTSSGDSADALKKFCFGN